RRAADPAPSAEEGAVGGANATEGSAASGNASELLAEIDRIRETFCSPNVTVAGNVNATASSAPLPFTALLEQIRRLCPLTEIFEANVEALNGFFSSNAWAQFFDDYLGNITSTTVIVLDASANSDFSDISALTQLIEVLVERGVTIFTANSASPLANIPKVRNRRAPSEMLASGSNFVRSAENPPDLTRGHTALVVGAGLILLVPMIVYRAYRRRQREAGADYEPAPTDDPSDSAPPPPPGTSIPLVDLAERVTLLSDDKFKKSVSQYIDENPDLLGDRSGGEWPSSEVPRRESTFPISEGKLSLASIEARAARLQLQRQREEEEEDEHLFPQNPNVVSTARQASTGGLSWVPMASQESLNNVPPLVFQPDRQASASMGNLYQGAYSADDPRISMPFPRIPQRSARDTRGVTGSNTSLTTPLLGDDSDDAPLQEQAHPRVTVERSPFEKSKKLRSQTDIAVEYAMRMDNYRADPDNEAKLKALAEEMKKSKDDDAKKDKEKKSD
ncbi:MAG: hypothetical protein ACRC1U_00905, partial [Vibrionaceae bacterium]